MPRNPTVDTRSGPRYFAAVEIRAEWDTQDGAHIVAEGETENIGPDGALVHLPRGLPDVGSRVRLLVLGDKHEKLQVIAEVLRIERNPGHPLAALQLLDATDEWRGLVWEPAAPQLAAVASDNEDDEEDEDDLTN
jgi:hypothetical protein